jgi:penicillin-insensitive murein endopeptidase
MVQALMAAAAVVHEELPGGQLTVNDLSLADGGPIPQHGSHRAGRDVDTLFYLLDTDGDPYPSVGAPLDPRGEGTDYRGLATDEDDVPLRIDLPRTWRFVQALIEHEGPSPLQRIFVVEHLRTLLLEHAQSIDAPPEVVERFAELTCQPSYPHDDHFHLRFFCSAQDIAEGCEDSGPIYPWRRAELRALDARPVRHRPRPDRPMAPTTTHEEAREAAGELHPDVARFLEAREAWSDRPHPGRRWCR